MKILSDYSLAELCEILAGFPKFRAKQVFDAIIQAKDYADTNLPKDMVQKLKGEYILKPIEILKVLTSSDGTKKYLLKLHDNNIVECVFLTQDYGNTICMSTQVGEVDVAESFDAKPVAASIAAGAAVESAQIAVFAEHKAAIKSASVFDLNAFSADGILPSIGARRQNH